MVRPELDRLAAADVVTMLLDAETRVVPAVRSHVVAVAQAAELVADRWRRGGRLVFAGAGTSGRIAAAEAAELPGTFGLSRARVLARVAGGFTSTDDAEDDVGLAAADLDEIRLSGKDVLVAVAASGSTLYTVTIAAQATAVGAAVIAVTTAPGSPLSRLADVSVDVEPGPEVLRGSSRLCAGTAQKVVLNALTTAAMAQLGRVHGDLMIDVVPANAKLRDRLAGIVAEIAECSPDAARVALERCGDDARAAVLCVMTEADPAEAVRLAAAHERLRDALAAVALRPHISDR